MQKPEDQDRTTIVVGVSGAGRSLANLLALQGRYRYRICGVFASRDCPGVDLARTHGLPVRIDSYPLLLGKVTDFFSWVETLRPSLVVLAGFIKKFPLHPDRPVINIHPALLPKFGGQGMYGSRVHAAVLAAGERETGATVHFVDDEYDRGAPISRRVVPVLPGDTTDTIAARVFAAECTLLPETIDRLLAGTLPMANGQVATV